jgi:hypothetical protein
MSGAWFIAKAKNNIAQNPLNSKVSSFVAYYIYHSESSIYQVISTIYRDKNKPML